MTNANRAPEPDPDEVARMEAEGAPAFYQPEGVGGPVVKPELSANEAIRQAHHEIFAREVALDPDFGEGEPPAAA